MNGQDKPNWKDYAFALVWALAILALVASAL
jgi:hypothetical protein